MSWGVNPLNIGAFTIKFNRTKCEFIRNYPQILEYSQKKWNNIELNAIIEKNRELNTNCKLSAARMKTKENRHTFTCTIVAFHRMQQNLYRIAIYSE